MFLEFYDLREQPFGVTPDPRFLFLGESHREALASLFYGIETDRAFLTLIAPPGLGKTTLAFQLLEYLRESARTVFLFQTQCKPLDLYRCLLRELDVDPSGMDIGSMHHKIGRILSREMLAGRRFVLVIDEAQNLDDDVLETVRLLSNFETSRAKMLQILLIGQPHLASKLANPALAQLQQRISVFARLKPFGPGDTGKYIAHRLRAAGSTECELFTSGALELIHDRTQGIPRNINRLCFSALSIGCAMNRKRIDVGIVREAVADFDLDSMNGKHALSEDALTDRRSPHSRTFWIGRGAGVAASIALVAALIWGFPGRVDRFFHRPMGLTSSGKMSATGGTADSAVSTPVLPLAPQSTADQEAHPDANSQRILSLPAGKVSAEVAVVQPGDTLRQIALRTVGQYSDGIVQQIRQLNPKIANPDHIEPGDKLRIPRSIESFIPSTATQRQPRNIAGNLANE